MKVLKFSFKDFVALMIIVAFITLICLEKYLMPTNGLLCGLDVEIFKLFSGWF